MFIFGRADHGAILTRNKFFEVDIIIDVPLEIDHNSTPPFSFNQFLVPFSLQVRFVIVPMQAMGMKTYFPQAMKNLPTACLRIKTMKSRQPTKNLSTEKTSLERMCHSSYHYFSVINSFLYLQPTPPPNPPHQAPLPPQPEKPARPPLPLLKHRHRTLGGMISNGLFERQVFLGGGSFWKARGQ